MKRTLSVLLSVIMVLSLFSCLSVVSFATDVTLESVDFTPAYEISGYENTDGYWEIYYNDQTGEKGYYFYYEFFYEWEDGNVITLTYSDGTTKEYVCEDAYYYDEDGNMLDEDPLYFYDNQEKEHWSLGTNYITMEYDGVSTEYPVEILESPVESIEFIPAYPIELTQDISGEKTEYEIGPNEGQEYFSYYNDGFFNEGNELVINYTDGTVETFVSDGWDFYNVNEDVLVSGNLKEYDVQELNPWTETGAHSFVFYYMGCRFEVPVTIIENPVATIEYIPAGPYTAIENFNGYYEECECDVCIQGDSEFYKYYEDSVNFPLVGDKLIVTNKDSTITEFIYDGDWFFDSEGNELPYDYEIETYQDDDHWELGTEYFVLCCAGKSVELPVEIITNPIESIDVYTESPITIYEQTNGYWDYYYDENGDETEFYYYECPLYSDGVSLIINNTDGTSKTYIYDSYEERFYAEDGTELYYDMGITSDQYDAPWGIGEHEFQLEHMGIEFTLPVTIVENPVESIEFTTAEPLVFEYEVDGSWGEAYDEENGEFYDAFIYDIEKYSPYSEGNELTVNYTTGEKDVFTYSEADGGFVNDDGTPLAFTEEIIFRDAQLVLPWTLDAETNYIVVDFMGRYTAVRVSLYNGAKPEAAEITGCYNGDGVIGIEWDNVTNATEYLIYRRSGTGAWKVVGTTTENYFIDTEDIKDYQSYKYFVHAKNANGQSAYDSNKVVTIMYIPPLKSFSVSNTSAGVRINCGITEGQNAIYRLDEGEEEWIYIGIAPGNEPHLYDPYVESGVEYTYAAVKVYGDYVSAPVYSNTVTYLATPELTKVLNVANGVQVRWNAVDGAESYNVYRKTATTGWVLLGKSSGTSYTDTTAKAGTTYTYTARTVADGSMSAYESGLSIKRIATPKLTGVSNSNNGLYVKWNKVADATEYRVYRKTLNSGWKYLATTKNTYYTDTSIKDKCGYYYGYTVIAVSGNTYSGFDNTGVMMQRLFAPALKSAKNVNDGIQFTWGAVSGARSYYVYRKTATTGWVLLGTSTTTTYLDKTAQPGVKYTYTARAVHNKYISTYQSGISVTRLTTPKITGVSNSNNGIYVKWGKVTGATEYRVYRKTLNSGWKYIATTKNNYYTDTAIKNNCGYYYGYTIIAVNGKTWSTFDNNGVMTKRLFTPVLKSTVNVGSGIQITWGAVKGAAGYNVYRKTANSGWVLIGKASGTSYIDETAVAGTTYTYTARAYYNNYLSNYNTAGVKGRYVPEASLDGIFNRAKGVELWFTPVSTASQYHIYRKADGGNWEKIQIVNKNDLKKNDKGLFYCTDTTPKSNTQYSYMVRAYDSGYMGAFSNSRDVIYLDPVSVTSAVAGKGSITIKWTSAECDFYEVLRSDDSGDFSFKVFKVDKDKTTYVDTEVVSGVTYNYSVVATGGPKGATERGACAQEKTCTAK